MNRKTIAIIGGGPVGLITAMLFQQSYKLSTSYQIKLYEKRANYSRKQVLLLTDDTMRLLPYSVVYNIWGRNRSGCYVLPPPKDNLARCYLEKLPLASVVIHVLEDELRNYIQSIGVTVISCEVTVENDNIFCDGHRIDYDVVIGADGFNSVIRRNLLKAQFVYPFQKQYGITVIDHIDVASMDGISKTISRGRKESVEKNLPQNNYRVFRQRDGLIYIGFIVSEDEARQIQRALNNRTQFPNWLYTKTHEVCKNIRNKVCIVPRQDNVSVFEVNPGYSSVYSSNGEKPAYLVGDALVSTNFFTGSGVNAGVAIANTLKQLFETNGDRIPDVLYKGYIQRHINDVLNKVTEVGQRTV